MYNYEDEYTKYKDRETIAHIVFTYDKKDYKVEYNFGLDYTFEAAEFMFFEGNYSCDCNRSNIINEKYPEFEEIDECGYNIDIKDFYVEFKKDEEESIIMGKGLSELD